MFFLVFLRRPDWGASGRSLAGAFIVLFGRDSSIVKFTVDDDDDDDVVVVVVAAAAAAAAVDFTDFAALVEDSVTGGLIYM